MTYDNTERHTKNPTALTANKNASYNGTDNTSRNGADKATRCEHTTNQIVVDDSFNSSVLNQAPS